MTIPPPVVGQLEAVYVMNGKNRHPIFILSVVPLEELLAFRKKQPKLLGVTLYVAMARGSNELLLWPAPHEAMEIKIVYYPAMVEA